MLFVTRCSTLDCEHERMLFVTRCSTLDCEHEKDALIAQNLSIKKCSLFDLIVTLRSRKPVWFSPPCS
jgi:hypothetical protein